MAGIYIHVPFCTQRCSYCDFFSTIRLEEMDSYTDSVCLEIIQRKDYIKDKHINTIYFGGGTPSLLSKENLTKIFDTLYKNFDFSNLKEVTLECNPDDIRKDFFCKISDKPINRLSIGIQSFQDDELVMLNRRHNAEQAKKAVKMAQDNYFNNISIDLMYGLPQQKIDLWNKTIQEALSLNVQHISAYHLSYEVGTKMYSMRNKAVDEETSLELFQSLRHSLIGGGFEHYEISNFAKTEFRSIHNSSYWKNVEYLGLGAGAHSYNGCNSRQWNLSNLDKYQQAVKNNGIYYEQEILNDDDIYNELIIKSLRTCEGININNIDNKYLDHCIKNSNLYTKEGLLCKQDNFIKLNENGIFVSDRIIRDLMI